MRHAFAALFLCGCMCFAEEPLAAPAEHLIADLNTAIGHEDWQEAALLFEGGPSADSLRASFRGSEIWSELGPGRLRLDSTHRVAASQIAIGATLLQPGSVNFRADRVAIVIRRSRQGWRIAAWNIERAIPPR